MYAGLGSLIQRTWCAGVLICIILWGLLAPRTTAAPVEIDPARSLFVTDRAVLDSDTGQLFSLRRVFNQLIAQSRVPSLTPQTLWQQWWDTLRLSPGFGLGPHCDSHTTADGLPGLNGFPIDCPRHEGNEALVSPFEPTGKVFYRPTALVNRFDLAPLSGENCGEYRMVFSRIDAVGFGQNSLIFEAVLPNPTPERGLEGCRPVARFWANLSTIDNPRVRARRLARFYFTGLPGFAPVVRIDPLAHVQLRTNMFMDIRGWQQRTFKLVHRCHLPGGVCDTLRIVPVPVTNTPFGELFDDTSTHPKAPGFRAHFLQQLSALLTDDLMGIALTTADRFNAGQSPANEETDYAAHLSNGTGDFAYALQEHLRLLGSDLTPTQLVNRALTQSCAGCHKLSSGRDLGHGLRWPTARFVHVDEDGHISLALRDVFLPHRQAVLEAFLNGDTLPVVAAPRGAPTGTPEQTIGGPRRTH